MTTITCSECGHGHECEVIRGETKWDDYTEVPERCESCGAEFGDDGESEWSARRAERQQMGCGQ